MIHRTPVSPRFHLFRYAACTVLVLAATSMHPSATFAETQNAAALTIDLVEKGTDVFYLAARVGDSSTELLFDTGSGYLALNKGLIKELEAKGMASYQRSIRARLANGSVKKVPIYQVDAIDLGNGCIIRNVDAVMLGTGTRNILGMNVLKMMDSFSLSSRSATLTIHGCNQA